MKLLRTKTIRRRAVVSAALLLIFAAILLLVFLRGRKILVVENAETGEVYAERRVKTGDEVIFEWEHSFEHIPWFEYYEIKDDGTFLLNTIAVAGFGAGIPAQMDVEYRYEDGLIYMDGIGSEFPQFNWINSQTALKNIKVCGELLLYGSDMPHHVKIVLRIRNGLER